MFIVKHTKKFISLSIFLVILSVVFIFTFGLKPGIDFKGGALLEVVYPLGRPEVSMLETATKELGLNQSLIQPTGDLGYILKTRDINQTEHDALLKLLSFEGKYSVNEKSFTSVGPVVGSELKRKAIVSITMVILAIIIFITYAFRRVSKPVASWKYGLITIITLLHDIIIPTGFFAVFSHYAEVEVDTLFVLALLTILGLSVHDKIVVFDRIRENLRNEDKRPFREIVGTSTNETIIRSINITLTTICVLVPMYLFGPEATKNFALVLTIGLFFGIYSSLFFASPLLVWVEEWQEKRKKHRC